MPEATAQKKGPPVLYKHHGNPPSEPEGGWHQARLLNSNPAFTFLVREIEEGRIDGQQASRPHLIYNAHPELYIIRPGKFPKFLEGAIQHVERKHQASPGSVSLHSLAPSLGDYQAQNVQFAEGTDSIINPCPDLPPLDVDLLREQLAASPVKTPTTPHTPNTKIPEQSPLQALTDKMNNLDLQDGIPPTAGNPGRCAAGRNVRVDDSGLPIYAQPFLTFEEAASSEHQQISLENYQVDIDNETAAVVVVPSAGMNASNTLVRLSPLCDRTIMMMTDKGNLASSKDMAKAFTSGTHEVRVGHTVIHSQLKLSRQDALVVALNSKVTTVHGQRARAFKSAKAFQPFKFERPVKRKLEPRPATNDVEFPAKSDLVPEEYIVPHGSTIKGVHVLLFFVKYADCDEHELNYASSDDEVEQPRTMIKSRLGHDDEAGRGRRNLRGGNRAPVPPEGRRSKPRDRYLDESITPSSIYRDSSSRSGSPPLDEVRNRNPPKINRQSRSRSASPIRGHRSTPSRSRHRRDYSSPPSHRGDGTSRRDRGHSRSSSRRPRRADLSTPRHRAGTGSRRGRDGSQSPIWRRSRSSPPSHHHSESRSPSPYEHRGKSSPPSRDRRMSFRGSNHRNRAGPQGRVAWTPSSSDGQRDYSGRRHELFSLSKEQKNERRGSSARYYHRSPIGHASPNREERGRVREDSLFDVDPTPVHGNQKEPRQQQTPAFRSGQTVLYHTVTTKKKGDGIKVDVAGVHNDDQGGYYFTIVMPDGHEVQTVADRLSALPARKLDPQYTDSGDFSGHWSNDERLGPTINQEERKTSVPVNIELRNDSPVSLGSTTFATARGEASKPASASRFAPAKKIPAVSDSDGDGGSIRNSVKTRQTPSRRTRNSAPTYR